MPRNKGRREDFDVSALEPYLSDSDSDEEENEELPPVEEFREKEIAKSVLIDNLPMTSADKVM